MHSGKADPTEVENIVDTLKKDGTFDALRRGIQTKIFSQDCFATIIADAEKSVDDLLKTAPKDLNKNVARDIIRKQLNERHSEKYEGMVVQQFDGNENICNILSEVSNHVDAHLGITRIETEADQLDEDHQVCDMEIDSDTEQSHVPACSRTPSVPGIAVPTFTKIRSPVNTPSVYFGMPQPFRSNRMMGRYSPNLPRLTMDNVRGGAMNRPNAMFRPIRPRPAPFKLPNTQTFKSYTTHRVVSQGYLSNTQDSMSSGHYMESGLQFRSRRSQRSFTNSDFVYY